MGLQLFNSFFIVHSSKGTYEMITNSIHRIKNKCKQTNKKANFWFHYTAVHSLEHVTILWIKRIYYCADCVKCKTQKDKYLLPPGVQHLFLLRTTNYKLTWIFIFQDKNSYKTKKNNNLNSCDNASDDLTLHGNFVKFKHLFKNMSWRN